MMSRKTLSLFLITACLLMPATPRAQNVLLPSTNAAAAKPAATVLPAPAATTTTTQSTPAPVLPTLAPGTSSTGTPVGSQSPAPPVNYLPAAIQQQLIANEKASLAAAQQGLAQVNQSASAYTAFNQQQQQAQQQHLAPVPQDQVAGYATGQQANAQAQAQLYATVKQSQQRLQLLQSGPIQATDLARMYQPQQ